MEKSLIERLGEDPQMDIAIKNQMTRLFWSKMKSEYSKVKIAEIDSDDYQYVLDAIRIEYGDEKRDFFKEEISNYLKKLDIVFQNPQEADTEFVKLVSELIAINGKESEEYIVSPKDLDLFLNYSKRELFIKKTELLYDSIGIDRYSESSNARIRNTHYPYIEKRFGISKEQLDVELESNPDLRYAYQEFLAAFYEREYEKAYLELFTSKFERSRDNQIETRTSLKVRAILESNRVKLRGNVGGDRTTSLLILLQNQLRNEKYSQQINPQKVKESIEKYISGRKRVNWGDYSLNVFEDKKIREEVSIIVNYIIETAKKNPNTDLTKFAEQLKNYQIVMDYQDMEAVYEDVQKHIKIAVAYVLSDLTSEFEKESLKKIDKKRPTIEKKVKKETTALVDSQTHYYYRANIGGRKVRAADPESRIPDIIHIGNGTKNRLNTSFISVSALPIMMSTYLYPYSQGQPETAFSSPRANTLIIDVKKLYQIMTQRKELLKKSEDRDSIILPLPGEVEMLLHLATSKNLPQEIIDKIDQRFMELPQDSKYIRDTSLPEGSSAFSSDEELTNRRKERKRSKRSLKSMNTTLDKTERNITQIESYARASEEELFKGAIPDEAITEIDPLSYDILLLCKNGKDRGNLVKSVVERKIDMTSILKNFFSQPQNQAETFGLSDHELYFLDQYYLERLPINKILEIYKLPNSKVETMNFYDQAMRTSVIKKILSNQRFRELAEESGLFIPSTDMVSQKEIVPAINVSRHYMGMIESDLDKEKQAIKEIIQERRISIYYSGTDKKGLKFSRSTGRIFEDELQKDFDIEVLDSSITSRDVGATKKEMAAELNTAARRIHYKLKPEYRADFASRHLKYAQKQNEASRGNEGQGNNGQGIEENR